AIPSLTSLPQCPGGLLLCVFPEGDGVIWGGTENELWRYQGGTWKRIRTKLGAVHQILFDRKDSLWVASDTGVHKYWNHTWQTYGTEDGLPSNIIFSIYEDSNHAIWVGTSDGISQYQVEGDREPPETFFTKETRLNQNTIPPNKKIRITYGGIDRWKSTPTERLLFSYCIDGGAWTPFKPITLFSPDTLNTGKHEIKVRSMDLNWNVDPTPACFSFTIMLPWYKEPNFIITFMVVLLIILILLVLHIYNYINLAKLVMERTKHLVNYQKKLQALAADLSLTEERERRKLASDLHDSISQSLSLSILELSMFPETESMPSSPWQIESIRLRLNETLKTLQNMTFDLCPPELYQIGLESAIKELTLHMSKQYAINISFLDDRKEKPLSDDIRYFLFRATRELLINATKHANANYIFVEVYKQNNYMHIHVKDDGIGISQDNQAEMVDKKGGYGLFNIQERLNSIGGSLCIDSDSSKGSTVKIVAPLAFCSKSQYPPT
ncbi:hypothetical protein GF373_00845, partial [bacterium]|nr:hypothetical protein [bacterium]